MQGRTATLDWKENAIETIVYIFTPTCVWCQRNLENIKMLAKERRGRYLVGVSLTSTGLKDYADRNQLPFPVFVAALNSAGRKAFGPTGTPSTILVSSDGVVQKFWQGAYAGRNLNEIDQVFGIQLPGVTTGPGSSSFPAR